jgi:invasion protein IalB
MGVSATTALKWFLGILAICVGAALGAIIFLGPEVEAQSGGTKQAQPAPKPAAPAPAAQAPAAAAPAAPAAPTAPQRTETVVYDSWTVTCRDTVGTSSKKACSATLPLQIVQENQRQVLGAWFIARNNEGALVTLLQTPMLQAGGVDLQKGAELKLGKGNTRKLTYASCDPRNCEASVIMDDAMLKEATAAADATITVYAKNGSGVNIQMPIKGIDKAIASIGR